MLVVKSRGGVTYLDHHGIECCGCGEDEEREEGDQTVGDNHGGNKGMVATVRNDMNKFHSFTASK